MRSALRPAVTLLVLFALLTGVLYPLAITGIAQTLFPAAANGSLVEVDGRVVGSSLIGQSFSAPGYFQPRPSAAGDGYDASASSGTNLAPTSARLAERLQTDAAALQGTGAAGPVPADAVTTSASGLDPHISPAYAELQIARVAAERGLPEDRLRAIVGENTEGRTFAILGEPRVNVLLLNLALDRETGAPAANQG